NNAGVPRAPRRGNRTRNKVRENPRQHDLAPPLPTPHSEIGCRFAEVVGIGHGPGDDVEQDIPLGAENDQRTEPNVRVQVEMDNGHDEYRKQQIGGKSGEKLRQGLDLLRQAWPQTHLDAYRDPNQRGDRDQYDNAGQGEEAKFYRIEDVVPADPGGDVA